MLAPIFPYWQAVPLAEIPEVDIETLRSEIFECVDENWRILGFFGLPLADGIGLCAVLTQDGNLAALRTGKVESFRSMAREVPQIQLFEREIYENWGIEPHDHPWLKPVHRSPDAPDAPPYDFYKTQGTEIHEVAVGPVHAGVIEPGHFRFQCYGENVLNLEIALGYQHRGVEKKILSLPCHSSGNQLRLRLIECIAGDASIAHATAQCVLLERLMNLTPDEAAQRMRRIGLELERLACHCGDLGAIAGDTGFLPTSSWNGRIRGDFLNLTASICGNRFGREYIRLDGVEGNIPPELCDEMLARLEASGEDAISSCRVMFSSGSVRDRLVETGTVEASDAVALGLVGVAAKACGLPRDARFTAPLSPLPLYGTSLRTAQGGDVMARSLVRFEELKDSLILVKNDLLWLKENPQEMLPEAPAITLAPDTLAVALVESWRGEICHIGVTGKTGEFLVCKLYDPSFHNWPGLELAMRNGQISNFPLCNKSFNLSYCGRDL